MMEVENEYKMTEIGEIPVDWEVKRIEEITTVKTGGTPLRSNSVYWNNGSIPWMSSGEINKKFIKVVEEKITIEGYENSNTSLLPKGTVMMAMNGQGKTRGTVAYLQIETTCNQSLAGIMPNNKFNSLFLYYYLESSYDKLRSINGEGRSGLNLILIRNFKVIVPLLKEQQKIAEILSTVDEQIEQTDQLIQKTKELKKGLMQQLLTKGIGHTEFKQTELGDIPVEWKKCTIEELISFEGGSQPYRDKFIFEEKDDYIRLIQIRDYKSDKYKTYIPKEMAKKTCTQNDVMIGRYGPPIFQILRGIDGAYNVALIKAIPTELLNKEYMYYYLKNDRLFSLIDRLSQRTSGQTGIDMEALKRFPLPLPSLDEQQRIVDILSAVDKDIDGYEQEKLKFEELKKSLMQQLLTGKTRVKVD